MKRKIFIIILSSVAILLMGSGIYINKGQIKKYINAESSASNKPSELKKLTINDIGFASSLGCIKNIGLKIDKNKLPKSFMVYKVKPAILDKDKIKEKALKFGISGDVTDDGTSLCVKNDNAMFLVNKNTGSEQYLTSKMTSSEAVPMTNVLDDKEYERLAEKFLKDHGLSRSDMIFNNINTSTVTTEDANGKDTTKIIKIEALFFSKPVDGIKYTGAGPKISVWFGDNGEVIGYGCIWRELEKYKEYPLLNMDEVCTKIKDNQGLTNGIDNTDGDIDIYSVDIILWSDADGLKQEYAIPYYQIKGKTMENKDFTIILPAISDKYLDIITSAR